MSTNQRIIASASAVLFAGIGIIHTVNADPLPGEVLKFQQLPLNNTPANGSVYNGHDSPSTAYPIVNPSGPAGYQGFFFADDFADKVSTPVLHLKWWGSYLNNPNNTPLTQFLVSFESDVPATPGSPSHPGTPLLSQIVNLGTLAPQSGTFTEQLINGNVPEHLYQYNAELKTPFAEQKDTVYWLKIAALTQDTSMTWGWHNRDWTTQDTLASPPPNVIPGENGILTSFGPYWHFQDDAVRGGMTMTFNAAGGISLNQFSMTETRYTDFVDGPQGIAVLSQDMAFELYTTPEPSAAALLGLGGVALLRRRRRR
jgi:hypothetical protein